MDGKASTQWVRPWMLRWRGFRRWHRVAFGPLCVSAYFYAPSERRRPFITHGWRFRNADGEWRHARTFRRWRQVRRPASPEGATENTEEG